MNSKNQKTLERVFSNPVPANIPWMDMAHESEWNSIRKELCSIVPIRIEILTREP